MRAGWLARWVLVLVGTGVLAGVPASQTAIGPDQRERLSASFAADAVDRVSWRSDRDVPQFLAGDLGSVPPGRAEAFYETHAALFGWEDAPEVRVVRRHTDALGLTHVRVEQTVGGVPVWGAQSTVHHRSDGSVYAWGGSLHPRAAKVSTRPRLYPSQALAHVRADLGRPVERPGRPASAALVVYPFGGGYRLAYHVQMFVEAPRLASWNAFVDATTGEVLHRFDALTSSGGDRHPGTAPPTVGEGYGLYSGLVSIPTYEYLGQYYLRDTPPLDLRFGRGQVISLGTRSRRNILTTTASGGNPFPAPDVVDADNRFVGPSQRTAVEVHYGVTATYDYFHQTHGHRSFDGRGAQVISIADFGQGINNAYWDGEQMIFGNGDGATYDPLVSLDVVAHEFTHAVTQATAGLLYEGESGALNEAVSDIFAMMVDRDDFSFGERFYTPDVEGDAVRYLDDPARGDQPDHYAHRYLGTLDNGGVHINSGIPNKQAYLMVVGGMHRGVTVVGVGREVTERVWFRALTEYFTPSTDFAEARQGLLQAATDLYGRESAAYAAVAAAWTAVGVGPGVEDGTGVGDWQYEDLLLQSPHPYPNQFRETRTHTQPGAAQLAVFFERLDVEAGSDVVQVLDGGGWVVASFTGRHEPFWAIVEDSTLSVRLRSDGQGTGYGYRATRIAYVPRVAERPPAATVPAAARAAAATAELRVGPNPTTGVAWVNLAPTSLATVRVTVVDALGREVAVVHHGVLAPGAQRLAVDLGRLPAGVYRVVLDADGARQTTPLTLVR